jgi:hypothetical protein
MNLGNMQHIWGEGDEMNTKFYSENLNERFNLRDLGIDGR